MVIVILPEADGEWVHQDMRLRFELCDCEISLRSGGMVSMVVRVAFDAILGSLARAAWDSFGGVPAQGVPMKVPTVSHTWKYQGGLEVSISGG